MGLGSKKADGYSRTALPLFNKSQPKALGIHLEGYLEIYRLICEHRNKVVPDVHTVCVARRAQTKIMHYQGGMLYRSTCSRSLVD